MTNRREFLQGSLAALVLPAATGGVAAPALAGTSLPLDVYKVIFDTRYGESIAYAERARALGMATHGMRGDITAFWYNELDAVWKKQPIAVAGLTAHGPLFVLEHLAWDHRMRVVFREQVAGSAESPLMSWVIAPVARV